MIVNAGYRGKVGRAAANFTYTGNYKIRKDGVVELLTSGTIVFLEPKAIDVFMVGGGGAGGLNTSTYQNGYGGGGGAGGYTKTMRRVQVTTSPIQVTIGGGGLPGNSGYNGGATAWGTNTVAGGNGNIMSGLGSSATAQAGASGGSGGGGGVVSNSDFGTGGSDGNSGESGYPTSTKGGTGQGTTTREFGEAGGKLYAGGGGGGRYLVSNTPIASTGGSGGGGTGGWAGSQTGQFQAAAAGVANSGCGGGGGARRFYEGTEIDIIGPPASGGTGIVCFRDAAPLPELAGTWLLNDVLTMPESTFGETINATLIPVTGNSRSVTVFRLYTYKIEATDTLATNVDIYEYGAWKTPKYNKWRFAEGTTASDKFREWLTNNATKQS